MEASKRGRTPDADNPSKRARRSPALDSATSVARDHNDKSPSPPRARSRSRSRGWSVLARRLQDVARQMRVVLFVHIVDERQLSLARRHLKVLEWRLGWNLLARMREAAVEMTAYDISRQLSELNSCSLVKLGGVLLSVITLVAQGQVHDDQPLLSKLPPQRRQQLEDMLGRGVRHALLHQGQPQDGLRCATWFTLRTTPSTMPSERTLRDLAVFRHTAAWSTSATAHAVKEHAYDTRRDRAIQMVKCKKDLAALMKRKDDNKAAISAARSVLTDLKKEEKLVVCRVRKYRLLPTPEQRRTLGRFFGTCRYRYNQAVEHFLKPGVSNAIVLANLYVAKASSKQRVYPDGMGPPPAWAHETPTDMRNQVMRKFQANVRSAFTNLKKHHIKRFTIRFKGKFVNPLRSFSVSAIRASITYSDQSSNPLLSIPKLRDIPISCGRGVEVAAQVDIVVDNGHFYAIIPQYVRPPKPELHGRCIALDPGLRTFQTGVDLSDTTVEIGRNSMDPTTQMVRPARAYLHQIKERASEAQHAMAVVRHARGQRSGKMWKASVHAKRTYQSSSAKLANCVKDLHRRACTYLTDNYDTILLPIFRTQEMVRPSGPRTHSFNSSLLGYKHYQFRKLLESKCKLLGKTLVVCSEMYSSVTCGACSRLHPSLGSSEVFQCPHCRFSSGRDTNAAFNILRFVVGASLQTFEVHH